MNKEDVSRYINSVIFSIKFDVGILVFVGTIMTLLKLERIEIIEGINQLKFILIFVIALIVFGLLIERFIILIDFDKLSAERKEKFRFTLTIILIIHLSLNTALVGFIGGYTVGWIENYVEYNKQNSFSTELSKTIKNYVINHRRLPNSLKVLWETNPSLSSNFIFSDIGYTIISNPFTITDLNKAINKNVLNIFYDQLSEDGIEDSSRIDDYHILQNKYPEVWEKINKDTINVGLDYSYIIAMPGYDLEPNTGDEVKYKYITTRIRKVKFENVVLEK